MIDGRGALLPVILAALCCGQTAQAQAYQCRVDDAPVSVRPIERDGPVRAMPVTGYTLALSWSPEYCNRREARSADRVQCSGEHGRFGLILHGLWPEGEDGTWPQWCPTRQKPSPAELRRNLCMTPDAQMLARQWYKHGSCATSRPGNYFKAARILWDSVPKPDLDRLSRREGLNAGHVREAFEVANRYWTPDKVGLKINERGWLEEVRLCYGKDFMPVRCTNSQLGPADSTPIKIWRGL
jgi:ribonuclease T2